MKECLGGQWPLFWYHIAFEYTTETHRSHHIFQFDYWNARIISSPKSKYRMRIFVERAKETMRDEAKTKIYIFRKEVCSLDSGCFRFLYYLLSYCVPPRHLHSPVQHTISTTASFRSFRLRVCVCACVRWRITNNKIIRHSLTTREQIITKSETTTTTK